MKRITIDIDSKNKVRLIYFLTKAILTVKKINLIELKPSHSKGWHIIIWTSFNYTNKIIYELRKKLGDDKNRIRIDKQKKIGRQTLFYKKYNEKPKRKNT